jgi:FKBP-type peptidyl-prolyl cis-trans isomerase FkpA
MRRTSNRWGWARLALIVAVGLAPFSSLATHHESEEAAVPPDSAAEGSEPAPARRFTRVPAPNGIQIRRFNKTDGAMPKPTDRVKVHYHGTLKDGGAVFDSSRERGRPSTFPLNRVVPCWTEAMTRLRVGETAEIMCPAATAYGPKGSPPSIPPNADLIFEVELISIQ